MNQGFLSLAHEMSKLAARGVEITEDTDNGKARFSFAPHKIADEITEEMESDFLVLMTGFLGVQTHPREKAFPVNDLEAALAADLRFGMEIFAVAHEAIHVLQSSDPKRANSSEVSPAVDETDPDPHSVVRDAWQIEFNSDLAAAMLLIGATRDNEALDAGFVSPIFGAFGADWYFSSSSLVEQAAWLVYCGGIPPVEDEQVATEMMAEDTFDEVARTRSHPPNWLRRRFVRIALAAQGILGDGSQPDIGEYLRASSFGLFDRSRNALVEAGRVAREAGTLERTRMWEIMSPRCGEVEDRKNRLRSSVTSG